MSVLIGRYGHYLAALGLALAMLGLGLDVWIHSSGDAGEAEEVFAFTNPGHVVFGAGLMLTVAGVVLALLQGNAGVSRVGQRLLASFLVLVTTGVLAYGFSAESHGHDHSDGLEASAAVSDLKKQGLSAEEIILVETSRHDHGLAHSPDFTLSAGDLLKLADETARAQRAAERYRSIEVAIAEGYYQITQDLPLIGSHFLKPEYADGRFDVDHPEMLIYAFQEGSWRLYGLSYLSRTIGFEAEAAPEGFTGPFDVWHWHKDWCFTLTGAKALSPERCTEADGIFVPRTGYMTHFWIIDNAEGVFAHSHRGLKGSSQYILPERLRN